MAEYRLYDVTVTLLTPLHIGSGRDLLHEYDYAIRQGRTWRINEDALLAMQDVDDPDLAARLATKPPGRLLDEQDFHPDAPFFRYVIKGTPRSGAEGAQLRELLKDAYDRAYLPGSSLKGALRTAVAWHAWGERGLRPERGKLGRRRQFAARDYEREIFGRNPNHDLMRALHIADSSTVGADRLMLVNARVLHRSGAAASPIEMEAIRPDSAFRLTLKLDSALFSDWARQRGLHLRGADWLRQLPTVVRSHTAQRLEEEQAWFTGVDGAERIAGFYKQLSRTKLPAGAFLLQLGWGTGWDSKTFGSRLRADADFLEGILRPTKEGGYGVARGQRRRGDPFPKSRRVAVQVRSERGRIIERPVSPMGWAVVQMTEHQTV